MSDHAEKKGVAPTHPLLPGTRMQLRGAEGDVSLPHVLSKVTQAAQTPYLHIEHVAEGGMGSIELVEDQVLGRRCALKRIRSELIDDVLTQRLFVREAQITGQLQHPCIVPVHQLDEADGALRFTMKLVDGRTFQQLIDQFPPGPLTRGTLFDLLEIVLKVCEALAYAHSRGVVHCDIKPDNIMVGDFGQVYVMDWGVARIVGEELFGGATAPGSRRRAPLTDPFELERGSDTVMAGTPSYLPPEQARLDPVDARTDVWAVGALLYFMVTRRAPYLADTLSERLAQAHSGTPPPMAQFCPPDGLPWSLRSIIERAMSLAPCDRYPSAIALRQALVRFMRGEESLPLAQFEPGQAVVVEGDNGDAAYVIRKGRARAHRQSHGQTVELRVMGPGEVFGETAILSPGPRTASVTAIEPLSVHVLTADLLNAELRGVQPWLAAIVHSLARRFREKG
ncbi:MAG: cyclic nucleotide-binding domain-containing protein [Sandaracinaceae bacterium]